MTTKLLIFTPPTEGHCVLSYAIKRDAALIQIKFKLGRFPFGEAARCGAP